MKITRDATTLHVGDKFRIEPGPRRVTAVVTEELLDNAVTATHYALEINDTPEGVPPRQGIDAFGKPIVIGEEMTYLDWVGAQNGNPGSTVFYLYELDDMTAAEIEARTSEDGTPPEETTIWREAGVFDTEEDALGVALADKGA